MVGTIADKPLKWPDVMDGGHGKVVNGKDCSRQVGKVECSTGLDVHVHIRNRKLVMQTN